MDGHHFPPKTDVSQQNDSSPSNLTGQQPMLGMDGSAHGNYYQQPDIPCPKLNTSDHLVVQMTGGSIDPARLAMPIVTEGIQESGSLKNDADEGALCLPSSIKRTHEDNFAVDAKAGFGVKITTEGDDDGDDCVPHKLREANNFDQTAHEQSQGEQECENISEEIEKPAPKKKKCTKPVKKVLIAKKDSDIALTFLAGKRDIADTISHEDSVFLARELWVFTHAQLKYILACAFSESPGAAAAGSKAPTRDQIIAKLEASDIIHLGNTELDDARDENARMVEENAQEKPPCEPLEIIASSETAANDVGGKHLEEYTPTIREMKSRPDSIVVVGDSTFSSTSAAPNRMLRQAAESKLREWKMSLENAEETTCRSLDKIFPLSGPVATLMTSAVLNFLASVKIESLLAFMSLKKTETGAICDYFLTWRKKCGYAPVTPLGVARYLLGVNGRIESALASIPPLVEEKRHWMMDPIVVMTGAAREFLIEEQKLHTAFDFVHTRTKDLAIALAAWRGRKGFVPLKGSGKVAMISGWKATSKESLEIESGVGKVLNSYEDLEGLDLSSIRGSSVEILKPADKKQTDSRTPKRSENSNPSQAKSAIQVVMKEEFMDTEPIAAEHSGKKSECISRKEQADSLGRPGLIFRMESEYDLHSKLFLDQVLGYEETDILGAVGIHTAAQLFEADDNSRGALIEEMRGANLATDTDEANSLVEQWITTLQNEIGSKKYVSQLPFGRKRRSGDIETPIAVQLTEKKRKTSRNEEKTMKSHKIGKTLAEDVSDPYELLSAITKDFLTTIGITTAEQFLSTRTTDIAAKFVSFRKYRKMPELKGLGSIASVSGWKANCRKFCKQLGWEDVAKVEPQDKSAIQGDAAKRKSAKDVHPESVSNRGNHEEEVPFSKQRRMFAVQGHKNELMLQFRFELSLRKSIEPLNRENDIFITFKGSSPSSAQQLACSPHEYVSVFVDGSVEKRVILDDVALLKCSNDGDIELKTHFSSGKNGCGLVELSQFGVRSLANQDLSILKQIARTFIQGETVNSNLWMASEPSESNIIIRRTGVGSYQYLLDLGHPMEVGQTIPICFPLISDMLKSERWDLTLSGTGHRLVESFHVLSKTGVREMLDFLSLDLLKSIDFDQFFSESIDQPKIAAEWASRLRLSWISAHLQALIGDAATSDEVRKLESLYFGMQLKCEKHLSATITNNVEDAMSKEFRACLLSLLEVDSVCASSQRDTWCPIAVDFFNDILDIVSKCDIHYRTATKKALVNKYQRICDIEETSDYREQFLFKKSPFTSGNDFRKRNVVVCKGNGEIPVLDIVFEDLEREDLAVDWYKGFLINIQCAIIRACGFLLKEIDFAVEEILVEIAPDGEVTTREYAPQGSSKFPFISASFGKDSYQPASHHFFLDIVWPVLREFGWRLEVANYPSEIKYICPHWQGDGEKKGKLAKLVKQQRDQGRLWLANNVKQIGFGTLPKFTKRLFIASKPSPPDGIGGGKKPKSTAATIEMFLKLSFGEEKNLYSRAREILELILKCFDELAPAICTEINDLQLNDCKLPRDTCFIDVFMQFLLLLPSLLTQSDLPSQAINDSLQVVQDLTWFCNEHSAAVFPLNALPSVEYYATDEKRPTHNLIRRLGPASTGNGGSDELTEVIWEDDKKLLSDFVVTVTEQVLACRATEEDMQRKQRKVQVGHPGAVCRHCRGKNGEGRYFFTTMESLASLSTVFEKHCAKCPAVPNRIKKAIVASKDKHHEQKKLLPIGSQQAYFLRLWDRLHTMRISGDGVFPVTQPIAQVATKNVEEESVEVVHEKREFKDALEVLECIRTKIPWKGIKEIDNALKQYYKCIDYGGHIYNTQSMPKHLSPSWLLAKVGPKKLKTKRTNLPGSRNIRVHLETGPTHTF